MGDTCETVTPVAGMAKRSLITIAVTAASCSWPCMPSNAAQSFFVPLLKTKWHLAFIRAARSGPVDLAYPLGYDGIG